MLHSEAGVQRMMLSVQRGFIKDRHNTLMPCLVRKVSFPHVSERDWTHREIGRHVSIFGVA